MDSSFLDRSTSAAAADASLFLFKKELKEKRLKSVTEQKTFTLRMSEFSE